MIAVILGLVLIAGCSGALAWSIRKTYKKRRFQWVVLLSFFVTVLGAALLILEAGGCLTPRSASAIARERGFAAAQGHVLGERIAAKKPKKKVLLLYEPGTENAPRAKVFQEALKETAPDVAFIIVPFRKGQIQQGKKTVAAWTAREFDYVLSRQDVSGVVSLVGLPRDPMEYWRSSRSHRPFLMLGLVKPKTVHNLAYRIFNGDVDAVIAEKEKGDYRSFPPDDFAKAFDLRYLLVTKENVTKLQKRL